MNRTAFVSRVTLYETQSRFYLVGSDASNQLFRILKIDRTESKALVLSEGGHEYSRSELNELLAMIHDGNQQNLDAKEKKSSKNNPSGITERIANAFGLLGFVKFLEGYYMLLVTKASIVAQMGYESIYKVEDVSTIYVPSDGNNGSSEEQKYLRTFQSVDLTTNFYFCYGYDLSRTLQENLRSTQTDFEWKYVWNQYMLEPVLNQVSSNWFFPVIHGNVGQSILHTPATTLGLLLIAKRSNKFAGARFMKRGASLDGYVANEVETEQIVWDMNASPRFDKGRFVSFVQHRGSVPLIWSQDLASRSTVVVTRPPPIQHDLADPFAQIPACHFRDMKEKYGDPIVVINLVKRRERRNHESILSDEFKSAISYLNQFLPPDEAILYLSFDLARCNKVGNVLPKLEEIAYNVVRLHGWFQTFPPEYCHEVRPSPLIEGVQLKIDKETGRVLQHGVPRTNCVDCLDRTNVGQFVIGKVALGYQLYALGLLEQPMLSLQTETCRALESLYEEHGDTLALQYAGSQLVHSIKTYKKTAIFQERSRDVIQTISRYYSNTFADNDKQNALNLFLGVYRPTDRGLPPLWDLSTDIYLHSPNGRPQLDYCAWFEPDPPRPPVCSIKRLSHLSQSVTSEERVHGGMTLLDPFDVNYRTFELSSLEALLAKMAAFRNVELNGLDAETGAGTGNQLFLKLKRKGEGVSSQDEKKTKESSKKVEDQAESSSEEETGNSDTEVIYSNQWKEESFESAGTSFAGQPVIMVKRAGTWVNPEKARSPRTGKMLSFNLQTVKEKYGFDLKPPSKADMIKYEYFCRLGGYAPDKEDLELMKRLRFREQDHFDQVDFSRVNPISFFTHDNTFGTELPTVGEKSLAIYKNAVMCGHRGPKEPALRDLNLYRNYVGTKISRKKVK